MTNISKTQIYGLFGAIATLGVIVLDRFLPREGTGALYSLGVLCLLSSGPLFILPFWFLSSQGKVAQGLSYAETTQLVRRGPYALIRHPQYLGYMLLAAGFGLLSQRPVILLLALMAVLLFSAHTWQEEQALVHQFGDTYLDYARQVPRFNLLIGAYRWLRRISSQKKSAS